jgi:hypothetical protein
MERRAPVSFNVHNCVLSLKMLRDMLIDVGAKKLMNEGQGECVISVELSGEGSRFPKLLCSVRLMLSHRWFCPCCIQHAAWSESATAAVEKGSPTTVWWGQWSPGTSLAELFYTYLLNCPFNWWTQIQQILTCPNPNRGGGDASPPPSRQREVDASPPPPDSGRRTSTWGKVPRTTEEITNIISLKYAGSKRERI